MQDAKIGIEDAVFRPAATSEGSGEKYELLVEDQLRSSRGAQTKASLPGTLPITTSMP